MKVSILGATGFMGGFVVKAALQEGYYIINKVSSKDDISSLFRDTDVIIDFSCPMATESMLAYSKGRQLRVPLIIGTTGLSHLHIDLMHDCAKSAPVFYSPNMSFVIAIANMMLYSVSKFLGEDFDAEILDSHHKLKKDAPSGTALMFGRTIAKARDRNFDDVANFVRYGVIAPRERGEIGFAVQRCGNTTGTHEIGFYGEYENLKIRHEAHSKEIFAKGAVKAAKWLMHKPTGFYTMEDLTKEQILPVLKEMYRELF